jgi:capsular exopolysaccharide synthesis family protein
MASSSWGRDRVDLRNFIRLLRDQWKLIIIAAVVAAGASAFLTARMTPLYSSSVTFYVSGQADNSNPVTAYEGVQLSQQEVQSFAELLRGPMLVQAVITDLGLQATQVAIAAEISTRPVPQTVLLTATVTDPSAKRAWQIATSLGGQFTSMVATLEQPPGGGTPPVSVMVVAAPQLSTAQVSPDPFRNVAIGLALGLLAGIVLAAAMRYLDNTIKSCEQLAGITGGRPVLGTIPFDQAAKQRPLVVSEDPFRPRVEAFRKVRTNLQFIDIDQPRKVLLFTSALPEEGKSSSACNLAIMLAQSGKQVILVEADLRRPRAVGYLGLPSTIGVTDVLLGRCTEDDAIQTWGDGLFAVLASGSLPPNPGDLLASQQTMQLIARLKERYDTVLIDAPPLLPFADAASLAPASDGAILVVRHARTRTDDVRRATEALRAVDVPVLASLLTMVPRSTNPEYGYGYRYYRHKADSPTDGDSVTADAQAEEPSPSSLS